MISLLIKFNIYVGVNMTEAEQLAEKLMSGDTANSTDDNKDQTKGRKKAAKDWVQHFVSVTKFIKDQEVKPTSIEELEAALIASWETKADARNDEFNELVGAM